MEATPTPGIPAEQPTAPPTKKRGCGRTVLGCLGTSLVIALIATGIVGWYLRWPEQWGLVESPAEELFATSPNPWAGDYLTEEFTDLGLSTEGITFYVLPRYGGETHLAYILVEEANGFSWSHPTFENPIEGLLIVTAASETAAAFSIDRVAVDYRDSDNVQVAVMTVRSQALVDYTQGKITRDVLFTQMNARTPDTNPLNINLGGGE